MHLVVAERGSKAPGSKYLPHSEQIRQLTEERDVAVEAMTKMKQYTDEVKVAESKRQENKDGEVAKYMHKIRRLETDMEKVCVLRGFSVLALSRPKMKNHEQQHGTSKIIFVMHAVIM